MRIVRGLVTTVLMCVALLVPTHAFAQPRVGVDVRAGVSAPTGSFKTGGDLATDLGPGPTFGFSLAIAKGARHAALVGFSETRFRCGDPACGGRDFVSTDWHLGTRLNLATGPTYPWVRLAMVFDRSEAGSVSGGVPGRIVSEQALGGEVGVGMTIATSRATLTPALHYGLHDARFRGVGLVKARYWVIDVGVLFGF